MKYIGQEITSLTINELVAGKGTFVDDIQLPDTAYMAVVRSPFAHARIRSIDASSAEELPGVLCVVTGREIAELQRASIPAVKSRRFEASSFV